MYLPIFDRFKDLSEADRAWEVTDRELRDQAAPLLEGAGHKQNDYFDVLMAEPKYWKGMAEKLNLTENDLSRIAGLQNWVNDFKDKTNINLWNYLRDELPRLRGHNYNTEFVYKTSNDPKSWSFFEKLIKTGRLDPNKRHIGSFMDTMLREARLQKLDKPMSELKELVNKKAKDGSPILGTSAKLMEKYVNYMEGQPDITARVMKDTISNFQEFLGKKAEQMNKSLPDWAQLPTEFAYPGAIINKMMVWSYAAGLGLRAAIPIRDALQVFATTMPVLGPSRFGRGLAYFAQHGWELAEESGALLGRKNIGDLYGDIFSEIPVGASSDRITKLAQKLLSPSRGGHNIGRAIGFYGEYFDALDAINEYKAGRISVDELINDRTHLWFNDDALTKRMVGLIHNAAPEEAAKQIALEMVDLTLWPYRRGMQPYLLRTGAGRVFGQFGMWPMNYGDFLRRSAFKMTTNPKQAIKLAAVWTMTNYAAVQAMQGMGADADKWFFLSPAGYGLSPHAQFLLDLGKSPEETPDGRAARKRVLEYPLDFFPGGVEMRQIHRMLQSDEPPFDANGHPTPSFLRALGFKPMEDKSGGKPEKPTKEIKDQSNPAEEWIKFELGYGNERTSH
jgi:hypothetical protein